MLAGISAVAALGESLPAGAGAIAPASIATKLAASCNAPRAAYGPWAGRLAITRYEPSASRFRNLCPNTRCQAARPVVRRWLRAGMDADA